MIVVEEQHDQKSKRHSHKYPLHVECPKVDQPTPRLRWVKSSADGQSADVCSLDRTRNVRKADPEDGCNLCKSSASIMFSEENFQAYRIGIIGKQSSRPWFRQHATTDLL